MLCVMKDAMTHPVVIVLAVGQHKAQAFQVQLAAHQLPVKGPPAAHEQASLHPMERYGEGTTNIQRDPAFYLDL